jgi:hypothetical protein
VIVSDIDILDALWREKRSHDFMDQDIEDAISFPEPGVAR